MKWKGEFKLMNIETMLKVAADSEKMGGWNDGLSFVLKNSSRSVMKMIDDDDLQMVAGGVNTDECLIASLKDKLHL